MLLKIDRFHLETKKLSEPWGNFLGLAHLRLYLDCERLWILTYPDDEERKDEFELIDGLWEGHFPYSEFTRYRFRLLKNGRLWWINQAGTFPYEPSEENDFKIGQNPPNWLYGSVFYQIFPDRFRRNQNKNHTKAWDITPNDWQEHFGGDLLGIEQSIPYLQRLGVNSLYLTPIFKAPSNHKYDTEDFSIDPQFGIETDFEQLISSLKQNEMHLLLDGVFNHVGKTHRWLKEKPEYFTKIDEKLVCWCGIESLPKLDYANLELRNEIFAVAEKWLEKGIDGWRLDAIHMLGCYGSNESNLEILRQLRQVIKKTKKEALILGEHFFEATRFVGTEDSAMNYFGFARPVWAFLAGCDFDGLPYKLDASEFAIALAQTRNKLPWANALVMFNLLNSHDTPRFLSVTDKRLAKLAAVLLFTYPGVPSIYYGDEIGLQGNRDPDNRRPMIWDENLWDLKLFETYQRLIELRKTNKALQFGDFKVVKAEQDIFSFTREFDNEEIYVEIDRRKQATIEVTGDKLVF